jgi:hypothetical protein
METKRDTYLMVISDDDNDESGVYCSAFTVDPAIELLGVALSKQDVKLSFNQPEQIIYALLLVPDKPIYRAQDDYEFDIVFTSEQIVKARNKFHRNSKALFTTNLEHETPLPDGTAYIVCSWIVKDSEKDLSSAIGLPPLKVGTWCVGYHIRDRKLFEELKAKGVGLSIEGFFNDIKLPQEAIDKINNKNKQMMSKNIFMQLANYLTRKFAVKLTDLKTSDGVVINIDDTTLVATIDGKPAPDGEYTLEDGSVITIAGGLLSDVKASDKNQEQPVEQSTESETAQTVNESAPAQPSITIDDLLKKVEELQAQVNSLLNMGKDQATEKETLTKEIETLKAENEKLSKQPAAQAINTTPAPAPANVDLNKLPMHERMAMMALKATRENS